MKTPHKIFALHVLGLIVCIAPPIITTLEYFPLWFQRSETAISAVSAMLVLLCCIPFMKQIKAYFKSPAVWVVWTVLLVFLVLLRNIIDEMIIVCMAGAPANIIGMFIYKIGKSIEDKDKKKE